MNEDAARELLNEYIALLLARGERIVANAIMEAEDD